MTGSLVASPLSACSTFMKYPGSEMARCLEQSTLFSGEVPG